MPTRVSKPAGGSQLIEFLYEFHAKNVKGRYVLYGIISLVDFLYILFSDAIVGRPQYQVAREVAVITAVLTVTIPLFYLPFSQNGFINSSQALSLASCLLAFGILIVAGTVYSSSREIIDTRNKLETVEKVWPVKIGVTRDIPGRINDSVIIQLLYSQEFSPDRVKVGVNITSPNGLHQKVEFDGIGSHYIYSGEQTYDIQLHRVKESFIVFHITRVDQVLSQ